MPNPSQTINLVEDDGQGRGTIPASTGSLSLSGIVELGNSVYHRTRVAINGTLSLTDNGSVNGAAGGLKLYDFPVGAIQLGGGAGSLTIAAAGTNATNFTTTAAVVASLGSTQAGTGSTLTGTLANSISSQAFTFAARTKSSAVVSANTPSIVDGTTTNKSLYLNVAVPAANSTGSTFVTVVGFVEFLWQNTGRVS